MTEAVVVPIVVAAGIAAYLLRRVPGYLVNLVTGNVKSTSKGDTAVLVIGMRNSAKYGGCPGSDVDASAMSQILSNHGSVTVLQNSSASMLAVTVAMQKAVSKDLCIIYYSGHGGRERSSKGEGGWSEFLCLNNGPLHDYDIWKIISQAKGRVVLVFDCCHSATMFREHHDDLDIDFRNTGFSFSMLREVAMGAGDGHDILVWSGCPADNYSYGGDDGGVFTNGIRGAYSSHATYDYVWEKASRHAKSQNPVRTVIGSGFGGRVFR